MGMRQHGSLYSYIFLIRMFYYSSAETVTCLRYRRRVWQTTKRQEQMEKSLI